MSVVGEERIISVVGLGYVGLPVAVAFGKVRRTIGFDINPVRIRELRAGHDRTGEVEEGGLEKADILYTDQISDLQLANFHIVAVPTPVNDANQPDLTPMLKASGTVGSALKKGDIVVYESTVYPGVTEEECVPILEAKSGLKCGVDFKVGYSPERINPGDKEHTFTKIKKVVSGQDAETCEIVAQVYESVVTAGVHRAPSIKVAEAAKVIENTQRDLNIALMNELALIFDLMNIDTNAVLEAAGTKWNFLKFKPGLVGGHCIGVDPYYLTHKAEKLGYIPQVILSGRRINNGMGKFVAQRCVKEMVHAGHVISGSRVTVLGLTFKENCPDLRNSKVIDIIHELQDYGIEVQIHDPLADPHEAEEEYGVSLTPTVALKPAAAVILAVAHDEYRTLQTEGILSLMGDCPVLIDVKGLFSRDDFSQSNLRLWRL
ncbi:MAG: nucleotide sugar dehydrogenase [Ferrovum myxofaciens]|uniref:Nucleotide sugar dehydrogenase n=3 Tax=root TaxID=1 RepID=A0A859ACP0_9PROT|nr:nucleotide sugar dehydrogenase [Ferrovum myxofaciens]MBW8028154.1 nucleotide sugar dehydrogenase [Ferrovum sp.]KXW58259.1 UDP-N-acetyl-D-glucosamine 6-dehydrogenase [Ferrovum myxofaciens]MBU6994085.1 nucleotide sugar dehydrogenase [Ferrovum myxofaciens]NDU90771.1 nucleotide sugar dehydrogenase [Ferrovum sp.]QKE39707.2 MAG: nucleotide sugar dehydrogenase [Ferrovum myxofaciens]